jgi:hypothetical protein
MKYAIIYEAPKGEGPTAIVHIANGHINTFPDTEELEFKNVEEEEDIIEELDAIDDTWRERFDLFIFRKRTEESEESEESGEGESEMEMGEA